MKTPAFLLPAALASVCFVLLSGCTHTSGVFSSRVPVTTTPPGAQITIDGRPAGVSPLNRRLSSSEPHLIVAHKAGWARTAALVLPAATPGGPPRYFVWSADAELGEVLSAAPGSVELWLRSPGTADPFLTYLGDVRMADAMKASGNLSEMQHHELVRRLTDFFAPPPSVARN